MASPLQYLPYCGVGPEPAALLERWNLDPWLLAVLAAAAIIAVRVTTGRERVLAFAAIGVAILLFVSPLCALTSALFAARSAHHLLLTTLLAGLIALVLPARWPRLVSLPWWTALSAVTMWLWHAPPLYAAALSSDLVYWLMQTSLLATAIGFWRGVRLASPAGAVIALLTYMVQMGLLGALLSFGSTALYAPHALTTLAWGMTQLHDQQLGGLIMWVPGAATYLLVALIRLREMLGEDCEPAAA